eukprot:TRINITY_DN6310_c0_g1_i1.p3 TRINITY_DN6310_c0_g1~~TRINITY_DN6310_c0_g1_i1.p3  ORF type:complete len:169 (-),score=42.29 TRINITY_DN6310_c0_g1_i1:134-640(-)
MAASENGLFGRPYVMQDMARWVGATVGLCGSVTATGVFLTLRGIPRAVPPSVVMLWFATIGIVIALIFGVAVAAPLPPTPLEEPFVWLVVIGGVGVLSSIGQVLFVAGLQREKAGVGAAVRNLDVAVAYAAQVLVFGHVDAVALCGGLAITASAVGIALRKMYKNRQS